MCISLVIKRIGLYLVIIKTIFYFLTNQTSTFRSIWCKFSIFLRKLFFIMRLW
ncbi:uncharacterized protein BX663DRAFT_504884 [Cokeromyces recurvatus]|uniref:uncharacterized protein n=1 Tax=Cokeromyces recurvatus TaxID=90255 RepID=UPI00221F1CB5|nr:uncharacterized protein BX663DRAFT_504884 [Cokeromyces recurvatus]KAI7904383.1 hypothetical protein BX663DRAFT_504884 [Cokeromyces recurvatus]